MAAENVIAWVEPGKEEGGHGGHAADEAVYEEHPGPEAGHLGDAVTVEVQQSEPDRELQRRRQALLDKRAITLVPVADADADFHVPSSSAADEDVGATVAVEVRDSELEVTRRHVRR